MGRVHIAMKVLPGTGMSKNNCSWHRGVFMVQFFSFELCRPDQKSEYIKIYREPDGVYLETAYGIRGIYMSDHAKKYKLDPISEDTISLLMESLKIYTWPKAIPFGYGPGKHMMGCDDTSWSIEYKETEKKTMRHIYGKGAFPVTPPYSELNECLKRILSIAK